MPDWAGDERRKEGIEFRIEIIRKLDALDFKINHLSERIEHTNNNTKAFKILLDDDVYDLKLSIQGDEGKGIVGISQKLATMLTSLDTHIIQDRWAYGVMISIGLAILGWTIFK